MCAKQFCSTQAQAVGNTSANFQERNADLTLGQLAKARLTGKLVSWSKRTAQNTFTLSTQQQRQKQR